jgi:predicted SnoaL-like aldol condensation-catalyzing enzyme
MINQIRSEDHANVEALRKLYADLSTIGEYVDDDAVLHPAARREDGEVVVGKQAIIDHELNLIQVTENTLHMDVQHIIANDYFGAVAGILRAHLHGDELGMPFCGLWRFRDGKIIEHWENAYDVAIFARFVGGEAVPAFG